jgi:hypothetical protein
MGYMNHVRPAHERLTFSLSQHNSARTFKDSFFNCCIVRIFLKITSNNCFRIRAGYFVLHQVRTCPVQLLQNETLYQILCGFLVQTVISAPGVEIPDSHRLFVVLHVVCDGKSCHNLRGIRYSCQPFYEILSRLESVFGFELCLLLQI